MTINFSCEICGKTLSTSDEKAGRKAKCPGCGEMLIVPSPEGVATSDEVDLPDEFDAPALPRKRSSSGGGKIPCPMCGEKVSAAADKCEFCGEPLEPQKSGGGGHAIIEVGDVITAGWNAFKAEMGLSIGIVIIAALIGGMSGVPQGIFNGIGEMMIKQGDQQTGLLMQGIGLLFMPVAYAVQFFITCGQTMGMLKIARGEAVEIGVLFQGGKYFWRCVGASIVFGLMVGLGTLLCIVPGIIVALMFAPFLFVLIDEDLPGIDCLWRAKEVTEGNKLSYFVVLLACGGINLLGLLALCVGLIFTIPLTNLISAVAYCKMTGQRTAG